MITHQRTGYCFLFLLFLLTSSTIMPKIPGAAGVGASGFPVADYTCPTRACMRAQTCSVGQTMELDAGPGAGTFNCTANASAWRTPYFDDSGIQISSGTPGNHWKRDFAHTPEDPVQLNWYAWVADKAVIDTLINQFTLDFGEELYVKAPSSTVVLDTLFWNNAWDFSGDVTTFMFLESDQPIDIVHGGSARTTMLLLEGYVTVKIGGPNLNMRFIGKHPGADCPYPLIPGVKCSDPTSDLAFSTGDTTDALLAFRQNAPDGTLLDIRINARDCNDTCITHLGLHLGRENRTADAILRGTYVNGAVRYLGGIQNLDAVLTVEDPHARGQGWLGTPFPDNNSCSSGTLGSDEKSTGFWFQHMDSIVGRYEMRYGGVRWFSVGVEDTGRSADDRFVIVMDSLGFTGPSSAVPGTEVSTDGCDMQGGKADGWPDFNDGAITRFMEISEEWGVSANGFRSFVLEATGVGVTCCADVILNGLSGETVIGEMNPGEFVTNIVIRGGPVPNKHRLDLRGQNITVIGGTWTRDVRIAPQNNDVGPITLRNLTIGDQIRVGDTSTGTVTLDGVVFSGGTRAVIPDLQGAFLVPADGKLTAPAGSTIDGTGTFACSGNPQSLPYIFDGVEDDCEAPEPTSNLPVQLISFQAVADDQSIILQWETASEETNVGWGIELKATDTFEEIAFVPGGGTTNGLRSYTYRILDIAPGTYVVRLRQVDLDGTTTHSPEAEVSVAFASTYFLSPPYPNPFNARTRLTLAVPTAQHVRVDVYDALGRRVRRLVDDQLPASVTTSIEFDGSDLPTGLYLLRIAGEQFDITETVTLVK